MRKIKLNQHEIRLFSSEIDGQDYQFFKKHVNAFKRMWEDQGREFWERFVKCFRAFSINCGVLKEFPVKNEQYEVFIEDAFDFIKQDFVRGKANSAKNLVVDTAALAQHKRSLGGLESNSYAKDPFYHKETRDIFRRFFGDPQEKSSYIKVYLLLPLYLCFGGSICNCMRAWLEAEELRGDEEYWVAPSEEDLKPKWTKKDKSSTVADLMQLANPDKAYRVVEDKDEERLILTFLYEQNQRREQGARTFRDLDEYRRHIYEERIDSQGRMSQFVDPNGDGNLIDLSKATQPWWRETFNQGGRDSRKNSKRKKNKLSVVHQQAAREKSMSSDPDKGISVCIGMPKADSRPKVMEMPQDFQSTFIDSGLLAHYMEGMMHGRPFMNPGADITELGAIPKKVGRIFGEEDDEDDTDNTTDEVSSASASSTKEEAEEEDVEPKTRDDPPQEVNGRRDSSPEDKKNTLKDETAEKETTSNEKKVVHKKKLKAKRSLKQKTTSQDSESKTPVSSLTEQKPDSKSNDDPISKPSTTTTTGTAADDKDEDCLTVAEFLENYKAKHPGAPAPFQMSPDGKTARMTMKVCLETAKKDDADDLPDEFVEQKKAMIAAEFNKRLDELFSPKMESTVMETFKRLGASAVKVVRPGDPECDAGTGRFINLTFDDEIESEHSKPSELSKTKEVVRKQERQVGKLESPAGGKEERREEGKLEKALVPKRAKSFDREYLGNFKMLVRSMQTGKLLERKVKLFTAPPGTRVTKEDKILLSAEAMDEKKPSSMIKSADDDPDAPLMRDGDIIEMVDPIDGSSFKQVIRYNFAENKPIEDADIRNTIMERKKYFEKFNRPKKNWRQKLEQSGGHLKGDGSYTPVHIDDPDDFAKWCDQEIKGKTSSDPSKPCIVCVFTKDEEKSGVMDRVMKQIHEIQQECQETGGLSDESVTKFLQSGLRVCGAGMEDESEKDIGLMERLRRREAAKKKREEELKPKAIEEGDVDKNYGKPKECFGCGKLEPEPKAFKKCQRCRELNVLQPRYYCEKSCQVKDWVDRHKKEHKEWKKVEEPF